MFKRGYSMNAKKTTLAAASAAALLATAPGMSAQALDHTPSVAEEAGAMPCVLSGLMAAANMAGPTSIVPAQAAICEKGRDEAGWFFCQGFTLYRW